MTKLRIAINDGIEAEFIGKQVGNLVVISKFDVTNQGARWLCKCICGRDNGVLVRTAALRAKSRTACKYCTSDRRSLLPKQAMRNQLLVVYKAAARRKGHEWRLSDEEFDAITQSNCCYCGIPPSRRTDWKRFNGLNKSNAYVCNGIDRKNNLEGYTPENSLPCCSICNRAKGDMTYEEFIVWLHRAGKKQLGINATGASV